MSAITLLYYYAHGIVSIMCIKTWHDNKVINGLQISPDGPEEPKEHTSCSLSVMSVCCTYVYVWVRNIYFFMRHYVLLIIRYLLKKKEVWSMWYVREQTAGSCLVPGRENEPSVDPSPLCPPEHLAWK